MRPRGFTARQRPFQAGLSGSRGAVGQVGRLRLEANRMVALRLCSGKMRETGGAIFGQSGKTEGETTVDRGARLVVGAFGRLSVRGVRRHVVRSCAAVTGCMRVVGCVCGNHRRRGVNVGLLASGRDRCGKGVAQIAGRGTCKRNHRHENEAAQSCSK